MDGKLPFTDNTGDGLTAADREALARVPVDLAEEAAALLRWWRSNGSTYQAFVTRAREMLGRKGAGLTSLHVANEMRHPDRGVEPVVIPNASAVLCGRVAAMRESDLRAAFSTAAAPAVDALILAGWATGAKIHEPEDIPLPL